MTATGHAVLANNCLEKLVSAVAYTKALTMLSAAAYSERFSATAYNQKFSALAYN